MAANFRISAHRNSENLHLKLTGDFDGSSALQLVNLLKKNSKKGIYKIIIHTSCLNNIKSEITESDYYASLAKPIRKDVLCRIVAEAAEKRTRG